MKLMKVNKPSTVSITCEIRCMSVNISPELCGLGCQKYTIVYRVRKEDQEC